jgi:hypothetical protein
VVQHPRLFLGEDDDPTGAIRKSLEHVLLPHERRTPAPAVPGLTATTLCAHNAPMGRLMPLFARGVTMGAPRGVPRTRPRGDTPGRVAPTASPR